jgi:hypothetical protein
MCLTATVLLGSLRNAIFSFRFLGDPIYFIRVLLSSSLFDLVNFVLWVCCTIGGPCFVSDISSTRNPGGSTLLSHLEACKPWECLLASLADGAKSMLSEGLVFARCRSKRSSSFSLCPLSFICGLPTSRSVRSFSACEKLPLRATILLRGDLVGDIGCWSRARLFFAGKLVAEARRATTVLFSISSTELFLGQRLLCPSSRSLLKSFAQVGVVSACSENCHKRLERDRRGDEYLESGKAPDGGSALVLLSLVSLANTGSMFIVVS